MRSQTDYILGEYCCLFRNVSIWDPRHNSDYYLILGCLCSTTLREYVQYLRQCMHPPLQTLDTSTRKEQLFADFHQAIPKTKAWEARKNAWILEDTWRIIDTRVSVHQHPARNQSLIRRLGCHTTTMIKADRWRQTETDGGDIKNTDIGPPPCKGSMEQDEGVVKNGSRTRFTVRQIYH